MPIEMNYLAQFGGPLIKRKSRPNGGAGGEGLFFAEVQVAYMLNLGCAKFGTLRAASR